MFTDQYDMKTLFEQLGLDSSPQGIQDFIAQHKMPEDQRVHQAEFWNQAQSNFLCEAILQDANWAPVVDELSERLRHRPA